MQENRLSPIERAFTRHLRVGDHVTILEGDVSTHNEEELMDLVKKEQKPVFEVKHIIDSGVIVVNTVNPVQSGMFMAQDIYFHGHVERKDGEPFDRRSFRQEIEKHIPLLFTLSPSLIHEYIRPGMTFEYAEQGFLSDPHPKKGTVRHASDIGMTDESGNVSIVLEKMLFKCRFYDDGKLVDIRTLRQMHREANTIHLWPGQEKNKKTFEVSFSVTGRIEIEADSEEEARQLFRDTDEVCSHTLVESLTEAIEMGGNDAIEMLSVVEME